MDVRAMKALKHCVISLAVLVCALAVSTEAHAQELDVKGPLAGAPAVIGLRIYREMRFQIQLQASLTLTDEYTRTIFTGGQLQFHLTDWLGLGVWGGVAPVQIDTALTDEVSAKGQTNTQNVLSLPKASVFSDQIARLKWVAAPQVSFIPLRGKLGIFEKLFIDTDFYVFGGVAFVGLEERADVPAGVVEACKRSIGGLAGQIDCFSKSQVARTARTAIAPTFGAGLAMYMTDFLAMTIEWRALPFSWNTSGTDESGSAKGAYPDNQISDKDRLSHFNHMVSLGFAFYLPTAPKLSHMDAK
jgi:hypothetical protein